MKIPCPSIVWFLLLSMTAHAALLVAYKPAVPEIGHTGHIVQLSVERAGHHSTAPATPVNMPENRPAPVTPGAAAAAPAKPATAPADPVTITGRQAAVPAQATAAASPVMVNEAGLTASASPAVVAGSPQPSPRESEDHLRRSVLDLFSQRLNYPAIARRKGWQGTVTLRVHIEPDGRITRLHIDRTSGYPVLDRAAVESLQLASVPQAGHWLHGRALDLLVPVEYRLVGG